ncbi:MAG: hypothetical protein KF699_04440 [Phycisphaeraceae bacterium]|nr:hypothetical protein [Phycisphaeraceae bacterium]
MTRGRDSTNVDARSPRLAITLRGVKILEHPKSAPELWGVVVPWLAVQTMGQHGAVSHVRLIDADGRELSSIRALSASAARHWPVASLHEGHMVGVMVKRARRRALRERDFDIREAEMFTRAGRIVAGVLAAALAVFGTAYGVLLAPPLWQGLQHLPRGLAVLSALVGVTMLVLPVVLFGVLAWSIVRAAWFSGRELRVTPDFIEFTGPDGVRTRIDWRDVRHVRCSFLSWKIRTRDERTVRCTPRLSRFVFEDFAQHDHGSRELTMKATLWRLFWWFQAGAVFCAAVAWWINAQGLGPLPQHPLTLYAIIGFGLPALAVTQVHAGKWLACLAAKRAARAKAHKRRAQRAAPANPAA